MKESIVNWLNKEKNFIIYLGLIVISFFLAIFNQWAIISTLFLMCASVFVFDYEKQLTIFMFCYPFDSLFYLKIDGVYNYVYPAFYALMFVVVGIKYLIQVIKKQEKINYKLLWSIIGILVYIALPINHAVSVMDIFKYVVALFVFYLLTQKRKEWSFDNLLGYASVGLIITMMLARIARKYSSNQLMWGWYHNFRVFKNQGLFTNPNWLAVFSIILIGCLVYKIIASKNNWIWLALFAIILPYSYRTLSRNYFICLFLIFLICFIYLLIIKKKKSIIFYALACVCLVGTMGLEMDCTKAYLMRLKLIPSTTIGTEVDTDSGAGNDIFNEDNSSDDENSGADNNTGGNAGGDSGSSDSETDVDGSSNLWIDGTPIDPGRMELWKRYYNDWTSSTSNALFGAGISTKPLGFDPHNSYIHHFWQYGIIGFCILIVLFYKPFMEILLKSKNKLTWLIVILCMVINLFESNLFNHVSIIMMSLFVLSFEVGNNNKEFMKTNIKQSDRLWRRLCIKKN